MAARKVAAAARVALVDFANGQPSLDMLPLAAHQRLMAKALAGAGPSVLQYGQERGTDRLRDALSTWLSRHYRRSIPQSNLFISAGASFALALVSGVLTREGDVGA